MFKKIFIYHNIFLMIFLLSTNIYGVSFKNIVFEQVSIFDMEKNEIDCNVEKEIIEEKEETNINKKNITIEQKDTIEKEKVKDKDITFEPIPTMEVEKDCEVNNKDMVQQNKEVEKEQEKIKQENEIIYNSQEESFPQETFDLINNLRIQNGLTPLIWDELLYECATIRAQELSLSFSHKRPNGLDWWTVNESVMYGENVAKNQKTPSEVVNEWYISEEHRANILDATFRTMGVALYVDENGVYYWAQEFGY